MGEAAIPVTEPEFSTNSPNGLRVVSKWLSRWISLTNGRLVDWHPDIAAHGTGLHVGGNRITPWDRLPRLEGE